MSTFIATQCCQKLTTKCLNGTLYDKEDKDVLISKLTSRIQKLEQQDKDYDLLNQEFKQLENDVNLLNEAKPVKNITSMMSDSKLLLNFDAKISYYLGKW